MNAKQKNIAIAEACGYSPLGGDEWMSPCCKLVMGGRELPDFFSDLNAMHEAEKILPGDGEYSMRNSYANKLGNITLNDNGRGWKPLGNDDCFPIAHATAAQRAEAFGLTLNLWNHGD